MGFMENNWNFEATIKKFRAVLKRPNLIWNVSFSTDACASHRAEGVIGLSLELLRRV